LSRGIYRVADAPATAYLDLLAVCRRAPEGMICLNSAASYWDLSDEIPDAVHLAIAREQDRNTQQLFADAVVDFIGNRPKPVICLREGQRPCTATGQPGR